MRPRGRTRTSLLGGVALKSRQIRISLPALPEHRRHVAQTLCFTLPECCPIDTRALRQRALRRMRVGQHFLMQCPALPERGLMATRALPRRYLQVAKRLHAATEIELSTSTIAMPPSQRTYHLTVLNWRR